MLRIGCACLCGADEFGHQHPLAMLAPPVRRRRIEERAVVLDARGIRAEHHVVVGGKRAGWVQSRAGAVLQRQTERDVAARRVGPVGTRRGHGVDVDREAVAELRRRNLRDGDRVRGPGLAATSAGGSPSCARPL